MTVREQVFNKYLIIKQDLINNLADVFNRQNYYTKKYRGNAITDVSVHIDYGPDNERIISIFVRHKEDWIKDTIKYKRGGFFNSEIITNLFDEREGNDTV
jgi:hypothetical protein